MSIPILKKILDHVPKTFFLLFVFGLTLAGGLLFGDVKHASAQAAVSSATISLTDTDNNDVANIGDTITVTVEYDDFSGDGCFASQTVDLTKYGGGASESPDSCDGFGPYTATWTHVITNAGGSGIDVVAGNASSGVPWDVTTIEGQSTGNTDPVKESGSNRAADTIAPTLTDGNISISGASGTLGASGNAYIVDDTVTATWNDTAGGDNNTDTISSVTVNFSSFGGGAAVSASNSSDTWTGTYTIVRGEIDATNQNISVTITDDGGNSITTSDTSNATIDNNPPTITGLSTRNGVDQCNVLLEGPFCVSPPDGTTGGVSLTFTGIEDGVTLGTSSGSNPYGFNVSSASDHGTCTADNFYHTASTGVFEFTCTGTNTAIGDLTITFTENASVTDNAGNVLASGEFTSASSPAITDGADPVLVSSSPADGATDVETTADIVMTFSEAMNTSSVESADSINASGTLGTAAWTVGNTVLTYSSNTLSGETEYTVTIANTAADPSANTMTQDTFSFTTAAAASSGSGGTVYYGGPIDVEETSCTITSPNGGEIWQAGSTHDITWETTGTGIDNLVFYYKVGTTGEWTLIYAGTDNDGTYSWTLPNVSSQNVFLKADCRDSGGGTLASDQTDSAFIITADEVAEEPTETPMNREEANELLPPNYPVDSLVKLPDDGNPETQVDSAVYYIGLDGKRHPFPNGQIFFSWYRDFSLVQNIDAATLASIPLGSSVLSRPGTYWVKIQSDPKTYYVEPGYTLRWIQNEATAIALGGTDWNQNIIDIEPTFFTKFTVGDPISTADLATSWVNGSLVKDSSGSTSYLILNGERREVTTSGMEASHFQEKFMETDPTAQGWKSLPVGATITGFEDALFSEMVI